MVPYCSIHSCPTMMLCTQHVGLVHVYASLCLEGNTGALRGDVFITTKPLPTGASYLGSSSVMRPLGSASTLLPQNLSLG